MRILDEEGNEVEGDVTLEVFKNETTEVVSIYHPKFMERCKAEFNIGMEDDPHWMTFEELLEYARGIYGDRYEGHR